MLLITYRILPFSYCCHVFVILLVLFRLKYFYILSDILNPKIRLHRNEKLDDLSLSGSLLKNALSSLEIINSLLGNHKQLTNAVLEVCKKQSKKEVLHIVDLGCGGGDCIYKIDKILRKHNIKATFMGIDGNSESIAIAKSRNPNKRNMSFTISDILNKDFVVPSCNLLISSHFIYHFKDSELVSFLNQLSEKKVKRAIFSELNRSRIAYYLFKISGFFLPISRIAKEDGLIAIQRAFTRNELKNIIKNSNIKSFEVYKKPWFRMIAKIDIQ